VPQLHSGDPTVSFLRYRYGYTIEIDTRTLHSRCLSSTAEILSFPS
jgi:hypothetical protein